MPLMHDEVDFALLRVFHHVYRTRHLTHAARDLGLSQPAVSRALVRLRAHFGDPLFVRTPQGMVPTPRADALAPEIDDVRLRAQALGRHAVFVPKELTRAFVIGGADFVEADLLPRLVPAVLAEAPRASITSRPLPRNAGPALASGDLDLVIALRHNLPNDAMTMHLLDDSFVCVVRDGHPSVKGKLTLAHYVALSHVLISPQGEPGSMVDDVLALRDLRRHIAVRTLTFLAAPFIVAKSDLILTGPRRILEPVARSIGLRTLAPPLELRSFAIHAGWHARVHHDPEHAWLRKLVREVVPTSVKGS